ncbi:hypothetical protein IM792_14750 [Mucilaginibacter sp. JRF]|uniref:hypothetical protein n=1 Tax=Mucilaginibacter sp. JRF TaxID=2780088 RepID=UPI00187F46CD|nr:hypothetical protein [Mucilaginibacter sp. JRF]MBE9585713.1 hypothetical protein [Mucilaginibacter sp. JRF]
MSLNTEEKSRLINEINERVAKLEEKIRKYGSFTIIANAIYKFFTVASHEIQYKEFKVSALLPEYLSLICLKFPFAYGINELRAAHDLPGDLQIIEDLCQEIIGLFTFLHNSEYKPFNDDGSISDMDYIAMAISNEELHVRNETFEEFHWERLETLYAPYAQYFKDKLGFNADEAIRLCLTIQDYLSEKSTEALIGRKDHVKEMLAEIKAFKYRNIPTKNFYPPEWLEYYKRIPDEQISMEIRMSMALSFISRLGHDLSFTAAEIAEMEGMDMDTVTKFLEQFSLNFGEVETDFSVPTIFHPLKDKPLIQHEGRYICPSIFLMDYALDRLFAKTLYGNSKKKESYAKRRHDYLLEIAMGYLVNVLKPIHHYTNLTYPGGEMDGIIFVDNNVFFVEAKAHQINDRAKKGYFDRIQGHLEELVKESHAQAIRSYKYLKGNTNAEFVDKSNKTVILDGSRFKKAYFISLSLEGIKAISTSLKVGNTLGLFSPDTFPWIVSLYDLKAVCEHMEGPAFLIHYIHRRREFFKMKTYLVDDELDLLAFYLKQNLRFDDIDVELKGRKGYYKLESYHEKFNKYYDGKQGLLKKTIPQMKHFAIAQIKTLVKSLEEAGIENSIDTAVLILELGVSTQKILLQHIEKIKKRFREDGDNHDFRIVGDDVVDDNTFMLAYWVGHDSPDFFQFFYQNIANQYAKETVDEFFAVLDTGKNAYKFVKVHYLTK